MVSWRPATGRARVPYDDLIEEALCFGWVDSTSRTLDDERGALWFARRKPGSGWARTNKTRVEKLEAAGLLEEPGRRVIDAAKADGSWTLLDDVEDLRLPPDLEEAFAQHPGSKNTWEAFPPSAKKLALTWIVQARRPGTRAKRVEAVASRAQAGERAP